MDSFVLFPSRIRWDVDFRGRVGRPKRIARLIRLAAPRTVELGIEGERGLGELAAVAAELLKCDARIEATLPLSAEGLASLRWGYPIQVLWRVDPARPFRGMLPPDASAVSFTADEGTAVRLAEVVEEFVRSPAVELRLPHVNAVRAIAMDGHVAVPRAPAYRESVGRMKAGLRSLEGKRLVVSDFFLWRILKEAFPGAGGERIEFSGCEAGSGLAYVDWDGNVYPCDSLPVRLGNLLETPFERIWGSPARAKVVEAVHAVPADCETCAVYSGCFGGCRGMAPEDGKGSGENGAERRQSPARSAEER